MLAPLSSYILASVSLVGAAQAAGITRWINPRCTEAQRKVEAQAWANAGELAKALNSWKSDKSFDDAMLTYMGAHATSTTPFASWNNPAQKLQKVAQTLSDLYENWSKTGSEVHVYCDENDFPDFLKRCQGETGGYAWTWDPPLSHGFQFQHAVVLCPNNFFDSAQTPSMADQISTINKNPSSASDIQNLYWNSASIYFHESVHWWGDVVMQSEWIKDKDINGKLIYGPQAVISTATSQDIKGTFFIADAWTMAASAIYLMKNFKLTKAPLPGGSSNTGRKLLSLPGADSAVDPPVKEAPTTDNWSKGEDVPPSLPLAVPAPDPGPSSSSRPVFDIPTTSAPPAPSATAQEIKALLASGGVSTYTSIA